MAENAYRIADEPDSGALAGLAVSPLWPFISVMFCGAWLSWGWFVVNAFAVGSPTRWRESLLVIGGLTGSVLLLAAIVMADRSGLIAADYLKYLFLSLVVWKLGVTYALYSLQSHTIELFEYYGGRLRNGLIVVVAAYLLAVPAMIAKALPSYAWIVLQ